MIDMLLQAAKIAVPTSDADYRSFWLGAIGIREDGTKVCSKNGSTNFSTRMPKFFPNPNSHAEGRVLRKLGKNGSVIYVARVAKKDNSLAMACPCKVCMVRIKSFKVDKVYYTINNEQYGVWSVKLDLHRVFNV